MKHYVLLLTMMIVTAILLRLDLEQARRIDNLNKLVNSQNSKLNEFKEWADIVNKTTQNINQHLDLLDQATEEQDKMLRDVYDMCKMSVPEIKSTTVEIGPDDILPGTY